MPGLVEPLAASTTATTDLRAVLLLQSTTPSWVGILWLDTNGAFVDVIDLRMQTVAAS